VASRLVPSAARGARQARSRDARTPQATPGEAGIQRRLRLELKLLADVGLVGCPNAGKSSLLARLSTARPKIAPYPFTTRTPVLGVVAAGEGESFVACDIPGLIEGAHEGRGLGTQFLRHIERTRLLVHVIDMAAVDGRDPVADFYQVKQELAAHNPTVVRRPQIVVANKMDLPQAKGQLVRFQAAVGERVVPISCATHTGLPELVQIVWQRLQTLTSAHEPTTQEIPTPRDQSR
jgi:GTP-binding protein